MSSLKWEWPLASANGLPLSESDCFLLLDNDLIDINGDLLRSLPKLEPALLGGGGAASGSDYASDDSGANLLYPPSPVDCKPSRAQLASDILRQLDTPCKQESFPTWLEEKVELPIFESIQTVQERGHAGLQQAGLYAVGGAAETADTADTADKGDTAELLREFETVYGAVELTHLTPPQSPPGPATQLLLTYAQHAHHAQAQPSAVAAAGWTPLLPLLQQPADLDREMAVVEELMRHSAAHHLETSPPRSSPGRPSPPSSPPSSPASPASPGSSSSGSADEEWGERAPRGKPYSRGTDDRRSRKKEQNKNAATRYRQKKKAEIEVLLGEENGLRMRHGELDTKCADLQREIRYIKGLMRDLFKAKGLIK